MARLLTAVAAASIVVSGAWFAVGPGAGPPIGGCSNAAPLAASDRLPAPDATTIEWREADLPGDLADADEQIMLDVVAFDGEFLAVGRSSNGPESHAFVLRSTDGVGWSLQPDDGDRFAGTELSSLAVVGDRIYGVGSTMTDDRGGSRAVVWFSDDGETWVEASGPFADRSAHSIAGVGGGLLLIGRENPSGHPVVWQSADGATWEISALELPVTISEAGMGSVLRLGDGWQAVGSVSRGVDAAAAPVAWRSADGVAWTCHLLDGAGFARATAFDLHGQAGRWLAVGDGGQVCAFGAQCVGHALAWASNDLAWSAALAESQEPIGLNPVYGAAANGFVAVAREATFLSADGISWTRLAGSAHPGGDVAAGSAVAANEDGRLVLVGTRYDGSDAEAWVAVGQLAP